MQRDPIEPSAEPRRLAVLTSGGDAAGMSACVRAIVRMGLNRGCETFIIREGWQGLILGNTTSSSVPRSTAPVAQFKSSGLGTTIANSKRFLATYGEGEVLKDGEAELSLKGRHIIQVGWDDVRGFLQAGGTLIGTARSAEFREFQGRTKAAHNLVKHGIDALVVCGGDGSLTGADKLREEWPQHLKALVDQGKIDQKTADKYQTLKIAGWALVCPMSISGSSLAAVGSIDNDMSGTDLTIGALSALHRICDAVDAISSTASSHSRAFVVEVMGRHCGWLAVMAAISTGADYLFIPESPPQCDDWKTEMCEVVQRHRKMGKRKNIVIVAEGAADKHLAPVTADMIKEVLSNDLKLDTRVTTLGHIQRGGRPCAFDRLLATFQGVEAVEALLSAKPDEPSPVIGIEENKVTRRPLVESVALTQSVAKAIEAKDFKKALSLRDSEFSDCLTAFRATTYLGEGLKLEESKRLTIGIIHVGAPAGGMNTATRTAVQYCLARGHTPLGIYNSWGGLLDGHVSLLSWLHVDEWATRGGSELGTSRKLPDIDLEGIARAFEKHNLDALLVIGGFEAMSSMFVLEQARKLYSAFKIPMVHIPATISNNVPLSEWSLGSDTAINVLVDSPPDCDAIKQSASASRNRVFVIECQGGTCGYIATFGAIASGALISYIPETGMSLDMVAQDVRFLKDRYQADAKGKSEGRLVIRSEKASSVYTTDVLTDILTDEGGSIFDARSVKLGHTLQGGVPTPRDRTRATRLAVRSIQFLERQASNIKHFPVLHTDTTTVQELDKEAHNMATIVIQGARVRFASMAEMHADADMKLRRGKNTWWSKINSIVTLMSGRLDLVSNNQPLGDILRDN